MGPSRTEETTHGFPERMSWCQFEHCLLQQCSWWGLHLLCFQSCRSIEKKIGSTPQLTIDPIVALKLADGSLVKFGKHASCGYFGKHGLFQYAMNVWCCQTLSGGKDNRPHSDSEVALDGIEHTAEEDAPFPLLKKFFSRNQRR